MTWKELVLSESGSSQTLDLSGKGLTSVSIAVWSDDLRYVDLSHNRLDSLNPATFHHLRKLRYLDLAHNELDRPNPATFNDLGELQYLDLSHNRLNGLNPAAFNDLGELQYLDLSHNRLDSLNPATFDHLRKLRYLDLAHNELDSLNPATFNDLGELQHLDLSHNRLNGLNPAAFNDLGELQYLDLSHNKLDSLTGFRFHSLKKLGFLVISGNPLSSSGLPRQIRDLAERSEAFLAHTAPVIRVGMTTREVIALIGPPTARLSMADFLGLYASRAGYSSGGATSPGDLGRDVKELWTHDHKAGRYQLVIADDRVVEVNSQPRS